MEKLESYTAGTKCWFKDASEGYIHAVLVAKAVNGNDVSMTFKADRFLLFNFTGNHKTNDSNGKEIAFKAKLNDIEKNKTEVGLGALPMLRNPPHLEGCDDLTTLSYLHEASVLSSIKLRYAKHGIYTYSGLVLVAMNPFQSLDIYSLQKMKEFYNKPRNHVAPHVYAIAEEAYRKMILFKENQSIIVSGESGAGKTQNAKYVMRYFAAIDDLSSPTMHRKEEMASSKIEEAVLSTNPIMESFGNSKTTRNDNSSRFGKYIEIQFGPKRDPGKSGVEITGAKMRTYLLERSRLVFQPKGERNYHIFYQLCAAIPDAEKKDLGINSWDVFHYLNQGSSGVVPGMDDKAEFALTQKALSIVGVSVSMQWDVFRICAALLHIGNIKISDKGGDASINDADHSVNLACSLLKIDQANFRKWLTHKTLKVGAEVMEKKMNANQAIVARDSVAKFIYSLLFDWLVNVVNLKLATKQPMSTATFIGVLDIYGFEHFKTNSFEQFCINYANEKLQQEFTRHVFKLEQEEYVAEGINWSFIDFTDNGPCIDLIESKLGILSLLDEETRLPSGTDKNFVVKLYSNFGTNHPFFAKPKFGETEFVIKHYAIDVSYSIDGFIEKNKDTVTDQQLGVLNASTFPYLKEVITIPQLVESAAPSRGAAPKKPTLGSIFRQSLVKLMDTLRATHPHYIRCIKPNQAKEPFAFEPQNVLDQLIACGVLETIKISRAGYPSKQSYESFANRYYLLSPSTNWKKAHKDLSVAIAKTNITKEGMFEIGKTKIFFRAGQLAYLEKLRIKTFEKYVVLIQKNFKRNVCQKRFKIMRKKAIKIQSIWRMYHAIKVFEELREKRIKEAAAAFELAASIARVSGKSIVMPDIPPPSPLVKARKAKKPTVASVKAHKSATEKRRTEQAEKDEKERKEMERKLAENEEQLTKFKAQYSQMDSDFKKRANIDVGGLEELQILVAKLASEKKAMRREMAELNNTIDEKDEELIKIRKQADKHKKQNDDNANKIAALEKEVAGNRKQLSEFVSQKYKDDEQSANFFTAYPETEKVGLAAASSAMKTVEWAAKLAGSYTGTVRPTASSNFREVEFSEPIERPIRMLESKDLEDEITSTLISDLKIPLPSTQSVGTKKEILFPAHLIGFIFLQLKERNLVSRIASLSVLIKNSIIALAKKCEDDYIYGFWISNIMELMSVIGSSHVFKEKVKIKESKAVKKTNSFAAGLTARLSMASLQSSTRSVVFSGANDGGDLESSMEMLLSNLEVLLFHLYDNWVKNIKKRVSVMCVPAILDHQPLHDYKEKEDTSTWGFVSGMMKYTYSIQELIDYLKPIATTMVAYYMEESIKRQLLTEIVRSISVTCFNTLINTKMYCTFNRGNQIIHNTGLLEEWSIASGVEEAALQLQPLISAASLLTCQKDDPIKDMEEIELKCSLNDTQIYTILSFYPADDDDCPLSRELLSNMAESAKMSAKTDILLLLDYPIDFRIPQRVGILITEDYIPNYLKVPCIQAVMSLADL